MVPPQFQILTEQKVNILKAIAQLIEHGEDRERLISIPISGHEPIKVTITLHAGHWIKVGSIMVRLENLPITYDDDDFDVDILIFLLNPDETDRSISTEDVYINSASTHLSDPHTFELWIKEQTIIAWNDQ